MAVTVDARGLSCPQPVMLTLDAIRRTEEPQIFVLVDTDTSKENVTRAANAHGCTIQSIEPEGDGYRITVQKGE